MKKRHFKLNTLFMILLLALLPTMIFATTTTGNDGIGDFEFNALTQVELEKVNINSYENSNSVGTGYTGEVIAFKVGTMTITYTRYSISETTIKLTDYQNYVSTIQTSVNNKSDMALIARVNVTNSSNNNIANNNWYVIDDASSSTNGNYVDVGTYSNPEETTIDFFFIVIDPDSLEENKPLTVNVSHFYSAQNTSGYNPAVFSNYKIGRRWYNSRYIDDATILNSTTALTIDKEFVTHYVQEDSQANIQIIKLFDSANDDTFFDGQPHDYYKVIIDSTINSTSTSNKFELGLQIVSENNFNLYLDEDGTLNSSKSIPYELYIKYKDGSGNILINNSDKYTIKHINSSNDEANKIFYLTTKSEVANPLTTEEGMYRDYVYLHFITEDYGSDYGTEINLD
jgi:hypothetical protein